MATEKLHMLAEQCFLAGDLAGALRAAREAQARCRTPLPDLAHALAAYEVHAAAAISRASCRNWYAVLSVGAPTSLPSGGGDGVTHEDIKRRYRQLCLVLHPDKNPSAAADGAFKLLQEAWKTLSARHPPAPSAGGAEPSRSVPTPSPAKASSNHAPAPPQEAYAPKETERRAGDTFSSSNKPGPPTPPQRVFLWSNFLCGHCGRKFYAADDGDEEKLCRPCRERARDPTTAGADRDTPPSPSPFGGLGLGSRRFPCPARCEHCGTGFSSMVWLGMWTLHCPRCHRSARVHVRDRYSAEIW